MGGEHQQGPFTPMYFIKGALAGGICCGVTHGAMTPVDVVKTRIQLEPKVYNKGMIGGFRQIIANEGAGALLTGFGPTALGYFVQGWFKFGGVEFFKVQATQLLGDEVAWNNRVGIYLGAAAAAEFVADIFLCPLEATRIRLVSDPKFASGLADAFPKIIKQDGVIRGFYSGFGPILFKQIPYTMAKFAVQGVAAEQIYAVLGKNANQLSSNQNLGVSLGSGVIAGVAAAIISHPADTLLSMVNKEGAGGNGSITSRLWNLAKETGVNGLGPRCVMIGVLTAGQFALFDTVMAATAINKMSGEHQQGPFTAMYFIKSALAGGICCSITHGSLTPVDVVKTRIQLEPQVYNKGMISGFRQIIANEGAGALLTGFGPTALGYFVQGWFKFGGVEFFKVQANDILGAETAFNNRVAVYLGASAGAEFIADIFLTPLEATRIRLVSDPKFASGLADAFPKILKQDGLIRGFYAGFGPILFKQIPYTMAKFSVQGSAAEQMYAAIGKKPSELSDSQNIAVSLGSGVVAGVAAAIVSHPADTLLSMVNKEGAGGNGSITSRLVNLARQTGFKRLFLNGLGPRCVMVGTLTAGQFAVFDAVMPLIGAEKFHFVDPKSGAH
ncbi:hypothetical protein HDU82_006075 [Entophlyctis luteolus]|nr:hypothetical protein HDU82_006075 [Entophlyctis luteolus]